MDKIVKILAENARISDREIATMLDMTEDQVHEEIARLESMGIIRALQSHTELG